MTIPGFLTQQTKTLISMIQPFGPCEDACSSQRRGCEQNCQSLRNMCPWHRNWDECQKQVQGCYEACASSENFCKDDCPWWEWHEF